MSFANTSKNNKLRNKTRKCFELLNIRKEPLNFLTEDSKLLTIPPRHRPVKQKTKGKIKETRKRMQRK